MAISGPHQGGGGGVFADINITPLTDIFLVLLIIFMVTTSVTIESAAHVDLPNATNTNPENKGVIITYSAQHELFVNSKDVPERELLPTLRDALGQGDAKVVVFQGDRKVLLGDMVRILNISKAAGATQIAIAAKRATGAQMANQASSGS
ncbi:MAG: biopolymer transporter ExbD [Candidatus Binatus sp.]|uniref:ExbD/TolR family protein n=1 Tax=Candidatus Binatus sp. TaxID=2811406 RepID=UPI00271A61B1|nr:biopolymer transporter ExbD [Candidatus Binatus sp.]MDO8431790.1 biopolymer transporter ExbD [Candidatus Binatus sp.]